MTEDTSVIFCNYISEDLQKYTLSATMYIH